MVIVSAHTCPPLSLSWTTTVNQRSTKTRTARVRTPSPPIRHVDRRPRGLSEGPWPPSIITRGPGGHPPFLARRPSREEHRHTDTQTDRQTERPRCYMRRRWRLLLDTALAPSLCFCVEVCTSGQLLYRSGIVKRSRMHTAKQHIDTDGDIVCRHIVSLVKTQRHSHTHTDVTGG